jgi:pimeloyl-ACP methyl ester carboxylesterase
MQAITINNLRTRYYAAGKGPDVLFVHGWAASGRMWLRSMWGLRRDYRLWALDLPGCGDSDAPRFEWHTIENYTDHAAAFCEALGIRPRAVIGHSMGGRIVLDLARRYPALMARVVAISATVTGKLGFNLDVFLVGGFGKALLDLSQHFWPMATAGVMSQYLAPRYIGSEGVKRSTEDLRRTSWEGAFGSLQAVVRNDFSMHLGEITQPTLLIAGDRDFTVPPTDSILAAQRIPNARLIILEGVHHQPTDEAPGATLSAVRDFIENGRAGNEHVAAIHRAGAS